MSACCIYDEDHVVNLYQIGDDGDEYICGDCLRDQADKYDHCFYCGDRIVYPVSDLKVSESNIVECPEHTGESGMDPEDRDGWEDNIFKMSE